jgi:hypothetical protein
LLEGLVASIHQVAERRSSRKPVFIMVHLSALRKPSMALRGALQRRSDYTILCLSIKMRNLGWRNTRVPTRAILRQIRWRDQDAGYGMYIEDDQRLGGLAKPIGQSNPKERLHQLRRAAGGSPVRPSEGLRDSSGFSLLGGLGDRLRVTWRLWRGHTRQLAQRIHELGDGALEGKTRGPEDLGAGTLRPQRT